MEENPSYYAVIPASVRYSDIPPNAKLLYGEITALCNKYGCCFATNKYFADLYKVSKASVSGWISELEKKDFVSVIIEYKDDSKEILHRYIKILEHPYTKNFEYPIQKNFMDNNIKDNNINININSIQKKSKHLYISKDLKNDLFGSKQESSTDFVPCEEQAPQSTQNPIPAKPQKEHNQRMHLIPDNWQPKESTIAKLKEKNVDINRALDKFINSCKAKGYKYVDFDRALLSWDWEKNGYVETTKKLDDVLRAKL